MSVRNPRASGLLSVVVEVSEGVQGSQIQPALQAEGPHGQNHQDASSSFSQLHIGVAGGLEEVPVGVWQGDRRVAWVGVNGLGTGPCQLHMASGLNLRVRDSVEASSRVCSFESNLHLWLSHSACTPSLPTTSGSCYSLIWIIGLKTMWSKAF